MDLVDRYLTRHVLELAQETSLDGVMATLGLPQSDRLDRRSITNTWYFPLDGGRSALLDSVFHDPWPRHYQHFGASLAVTADAYRRAGGLPPVPAARVGDAAIDRRTSGTRSRAGVTGGRARCRLEYTAKRAFRGPPTASAWRARRL